MQPVYDPFRQAYKLLSSLHDAYPIEQLVADILAGRVFLVQDDSLTAVIQFVGRDSVHLLAIVGHGCTTEKLRALCALTERSTVICLPKTPAHARLYKRLGFVDTGEEFVWRS